MSVSYPCLAIPEPTSDNHPLMTLQLIASPLSLMPMDIYSPSWAHLSHPFIRTQLISSLQELATPDTRPLWAAQRRERLVVGASQVVHFLFDDNDFGEASVGAMLLSTDEVAFIDALKRELDSVIDGLPPDGPDDDYVTHPRWPYVTAASLTARKAII